MSILVKELEFKIPSHTSSGGYLEFKTRMNGEVTITVMSLNYDGKTPRLDVRVDPEDLKDVLRVIVALHEGGKNLI